jgi:hypothetical protein
VIHDSHHVCSRLTQRDKLVVYEVMIEELDVEWWRRYRLSLQVRFRQESIGVRSQEIRLL